MILNNCTRNYNEIPKRKLSLIRFMILNTFEDYQNLRSHRYIRSSKKKKIVVLILVISGVERRGAGALGGLRKNSRNPDITWSTLTQYLDEAFRDLISAVHWTRFISHWIFCLLLRFFQETKMTILLELSYRDEI